MCKTLKVTESGDHYKIKANPAESVPAISLKGKWLKEIGIQAGAQVSVSIDEHNRIIITGEQK